MCCIAWRFNAYLGFLPFHSYILILVWGYHLISTKNLVEDFFFYPVKIIHQLKLCSYSRIFVWSSFLVIMDIDFRENALSFILYCCEFWSYVYPTLQFWWTEWHTSTEKNISITQNICISKHYFHGYSTVYYINLVH